MQDPDLFPLHEDLVPDPTRTEPAVWIERLVILREPSVNAVIRQVPFECGMNIIRTEERTDLEEDVVAHSVGKTLLMRLIRYSLGEPNYASNESQDDLANALPDALIVAHWHVAGEDWIVRRPLHDHDPASATAIRGCIWHEALNVQADTVSLKSFLKRLDTVNRGDLPAFEIAKDRRPQWSDILGWLARDCECGYRQANEWRHQDTNLGKPNDLNVNKLLMQWLCGLMSADEAELRNERRQLLVEQGKAKASAEKQTRAASFREDGLRDSMKRPKDAKERPQPKSDLFGDVPEPTLTDKAESMLRSLRKILEEIRANSPISSLATRVSLIQAKLDQANKTAGEATGNLKSAKKYQCDLKSAHLEPKHLDKCPDNPCGLRNLLKHHREAGKDEAAEDNLANVNSEIADQTESELRANEACKQITDELDVAKSELEAAKGKLADNERKLNERIGRWKQHVKDAVRIAKLTTETLQQESALADLIKTVDASSTKQESARATLEHGQLVSEASVAYTQVLQRVFNKSASGIVQVDGHGLQPKPAKQLTPGGRALSAMATVISFDLACVMASIAGIGNHPRFLIHDSPREGEMEMPLFKRIFDVACYLESCFQGTTPSFQYIVTTTKAPPSYCAEHEPHTRLVLHGRSDEGRLLRQTF